MSWYYFDAWFAPQGKWVRYYQLGPVWVSEAQAKAHAAGLWRSSVVSNETAAQRPVLIRVFVWSGSSWSLA